VGAGAAETQHLNEGKLGGYILRIHDTSGPAEIM
jgi:hypothetical protein